MAIHQGKQEDRVKTEQTNSAGRHHALQRVGLPLLLLLLCQATAQAQLYKWVGPDGKVNYTDRPPAAAATKVEKKVLDGGSTGEAALPFELAQAARDNPVILYTTAQCAPCEDAKAMLRARGIPYAEKTVNTHEDQIKLRQFNDKAELPLLVVGRNKQIGYERGAWGSALTAAAYPESNILPSTYHYRPAAPAAQPKPLPTPTPQPQAAPEPIPDAPSTSRPQEGTPPGFRF
jgi:glutaredoxin